MKKIIQAKNRINPNLKFIPTWYFEDELQCFDDSQWKSVIKDTFMWYLSSFQGWTTGNSKTSSDDLKIQLQTYLSTARTKISPTNFITGIYTNKTEDQIPYGSDLVRDIVSWAKQQSNGVALFGMIAPIYDLHYFHNDPYFYQLFQQPINDDPSYNYKLSWRGGSYPRLYQAITQVITLPTNLRNAKIAFKIRDDRQLPGSLGNWFKQLLVNDKVVWQADTIADDMEASTVEQDITSYLSGSQAKITIRLLTKRPMNGPRVNVYLGNIKIYLNNTLIPNNWNFKADLEDINEFIANYNVIKQVLKSNR